MRRRRLTVVNSSTSLAYSCSKGPPGDVDVPCNQSERRLHGQPSTSLTRIHSGDPRVCKTAARLQPPGSPECRRAVEGSSRWCENSLCSRTVADAGVSSTDVAGLAGVPAIPVESGHEAALPRAPQPRHRSDSPSLNRKDRGSTFLPAPLLPEWATPYGLRHFYASTLVRSGASTNVIQPRLGRGLARRTSTSTVTEFAMRTTGPGKPSRMRSVPRTRHKHQSSSNTRFRRSDSDGRPRIRMP
jgi:hypothetical protein